MVQGQPEVLNWFYPFLEPSHIIISKRRLLNVIEMSYKLTIYKYNFGHMVSQGNKFLISEETWKNIVRCRPF